MLDRSLPLYVSWISWCTLQFLPLVVHYYVSWISWCSIVPATCSTLLCQLDQLVYFSSCHLQYTTMLAGLVGVVQFLPLVVHYYVSWISWCTLQFLPLVVHYYVSWISWCTLVPATCSTLLCQLDQLVQYSSCHLQYTTMLAGLAGVLYSSCHLQYTTMLAGLAGVLQFLPLVVHYYVSWISWCSIVPATCSTLLCQLDQLVYFSSCHLQYTTMLAGLAGVLQFLPLVVHYYVSWISWCTLVPATCSTLLCQLDQLVYFSSCHLQYTTMLAGLAGVLQFLPLVVHYYVSWISWCTLVPATCSTLLCQLDQLVYFSSCHLQYTTMLAGLVGVVQFLPLVVHYYVSWISWCTLVPATCCTLLCQLDQLVYFIVPATCSTLLCQLDQLVYFSSCHLQYTTMSAGLAGVLQFLPLVVHYYVSWISWCTLVPATCSTLLCQLDQLVYFSSCYLQYTTMLAGLAGVLQFLPLVVHYYVSWISWCTLVPATCSTLLCQLDQLVYFSSCHLQYTTMSAGLAGVLQFLPLVVHYYVSWISWCTLVPATCSTLLCQLDQLVYFSSCHLQYTTMLAGLVGVVQFLPLVVHYYVSWISWCTLVPATCSTLLCQLDQLVQYSSCHLQYTTMLAGLAGVLYSSCHLQYTTMLAGLAGVLQFLPLVVHYYVSWISWCTLVPATCSTLLCQLDQLVYFSSCHLQYTTMSAGLAGVLQFLLLVVHYYVSWTSWCTLVPATCSTLLCQLDQLVQYSSCHLQYTTMLAGLAGVLQFLPLVVHYYVSWISWCTLVPATCSILLCQLDQLVYFIVPAHLQYTTMLAGLADVLQFLPLVVHYYVSWISWCTLVPATCSTLLCQLDQQVYFSSCHLQYTTMLAGLAGVLQFLPLVVHYYVSWISWCTLVPATCSTLLCQLDQLVYFSSCHLQYTTMSAGLAGVLQFLPLVVHYYVSWTSWCTLVPATCSTLLCQLDQLVQYTSCHLQYTTMLAGLAGVLQFLPLVVHYYVSWISWCTLVPATCSILLCQLDQLVYFIVPAHLQYTTMLAGLADVLQFLPLVVHYYVSWISWCTLVPATCSTLLCQLDQQVYFSSCHLQYTTMLAGLADVLQFLPLVVHYYVSWISWCTIVPATCSTLLYQLDQLVYYSSCHLQYTTM